MHAGYCQAETPTFNLYALCARAQVKETVEMLVNEAQLYSTVDDDTHRAWAKRMFPACRTVLASVGIKLGQDVLSCSEPE
eukprot:1155322-Pelagomonas_calceolata.AAC.3